MLNKEINKRIIRLAVPMAITQLIVIASNFLCMMMLAKLGHDVLAASALISSIHISINFISMSLLFSLSILIGHAYGKKDYLAIGKLLQQGWLAALAISIPSMLILWNIYPILIFFNQEPIVANIAKEFFHASFWRVVPLLLSVCNQQLCYAVHKQKLDLIANIISAIVLLSSSYILIFGKFGFPQLGVAGLGYAFVIQGFCYFLFTTGCLYFMNDFKLFHLFQVRVRQNWRQITTLFKTGLPISLQASIEVLSLLVSTTFVGWLGINALAAYQIIMQYQFLIFAPVFAISQACGVLISHAYGSKQFNEIKKLNAGSIRIAAIISGLTGLIFILFPKALASLYLNPFDPANTQTIHLVIILFAVIAISQFFDTIRNVLVGSLRGLLDTKFPMVISILSIWVIGMSLGYLLAFPLQWGVIGLIIGMAIGIASGTFMLYQRWRMMEKKLFNVRDIDIHSTL